MLIIILLPFFIGAILAIVSGIRALISIKKNRSAGKVLAIISLICCLLSLLEGSIFKVRTSTLIMLLLPEYILLFLYLIGVNRYNQ